MSWASFNIIEIMSSPSYLHRRVGYLAAALSFTKDTDVILLTTHLFRKVHLPTLPTPCAEPMTSWQGFSSQSSGKDGDANEGQQYEIGGALSCLANIVTPDLAQDLLSDIYGLMNRQAPGTPPFCLDRHVSSCVTAPVLTSARRLSWCCCAFSTNGPRSISHDPHWLGPHPFVFIGVATFIRPLEGEIG